MRNFVAPADGAVGLRLVRFHFHPDGLDVYVPLPGWLVVSDTVQVLFGPRWHSDALPTSIVDLRPL